MKLNLNNNLINSDQTFIPSGEKTKFSGDKFNKNYYLQEEWKNYYNQDLIEFVNKELDTDLMVNFGYKYLLKDLNK